MPYHLIGIGVMADLLINLAAGWFATVVIIPITWLGTKTPRLDLAFTNLFLSIMCLAAAIYLRTLIS